MPRPVILPIATLLPHEKVEEHDVRQIMEGLAKDRIVRTPILLAKDHNVVLDGHHRLEALKRLGATHAPCHVVDYARADIHVEAWKLGLTLPTKEEVLRRAKAGDLFDAKTTKHILPQAVPRCSVKLTALGVRG